MWWLIPVAAAAVAKLAYDAVYKRPNEQPRTHQARPKSILESNLARLDKQLHGDRGKKRIAIFGQPGAGKSSLLKKMTGGAATPPPIIGVQTDATDWSKSTECDLLSTYLDCVFADVPGYDTDSHPTDTFIHHFPWNRFEIYIFVVKGKLLHADELIFTHITSSKGTVCIAKSFSESQDKTERSAIKRDLKSRLYIRPGTPFIFFDNRSGEGISAVYRAIRKKLKELGN